MVRLVVINKYLRISSAGAWVTRLMYAIARVLYDTDCKASCIYLKVCLCKCTNYDMIETPLQLNRPDVFVNERVLPISHWEVLYIERPTVNNNNCSEGS